VTLTAGATGRGGPDGAASRGQPDGRRGAGTHQETSVEAGRLPDLVRAGGAAGRWLWRTNDLTLLGTGQALSIELAPGWAQPGHVGLVTRTLAQITPTEGPSQARPPWSGPVGVGALPYDPVLGGHLTVPRLLVGARHDQAWATLVLAEDEIAGQSALAVARRALERELAYMDQTKQIETTEDQDLPDAFELTAAMPHRTWKDLVRRAVAEMADGPLAKVVLARRVDVVANRPIVLPETLARLTSLYPSCTVFHVDGFIGASPETLVRRAGTDILSHPMAGTVPRSGDDVTDAALLAGLMASPKERWEHQLVVDAIDAQLRPLCQSLEVPAEPSVIALRNVSHLGTRLSGILAPIGEATNGAAPSLPTALELAARLQPTPAVGGYPSELALSWQRANEGFERGRYAGPVGWVDTAGDGDWALGLRSAVVSGRTAQLYAGGGIVAGSDPDTELAETQLKLQALLAALVRP